MFVSILARSGDRALPAAAMTAASGVSLFQSSPGLVTGRYEENNSGRLLRFRFNPRPVW